ncbi:polyribonucleotide 5'-hydroxyl-kinase Clp1-like [Paramacrobiotus metropolitanus]|uniref:polyribonucleotide 5'-hydroxyl-kinase Clp1-like n=1 Tax=Paramacrobiotus metropolitanus TaxID=2943436 RepID=UPI002445D716|nr:polyribonucleotide 5'-hydroxyl-kinase Clp1-like [Paramacrobiotus metropolitanus]
MDMSRKELDLLHGHQVAIIPGYKRSVYVELVEGQAEIFGMFMSADERYCFTYPHRAVLATYDGCRVAVEADNCDLEVQVIKDDPFPALVGAMHAVLEQQRQDAVKSAGEVVGPKVLVVGPMDSGKSSCCRALLNYAVQAGWNPTFVDVDAGQQGLTLPGTLSSAILRAGTNELGQVDHAERVDLPFGRVNLNEDCKLYQAQIWKLAEFVQSSFSNAHLRASGAIINTAGWIDSNGFLLLLEIAKAFQVDKVIALENVYLGHQFRQWAADHGVLLDVLFARKPTCLAERSIETRRDYRDCMVQSVFVRRPKFTVTVPLSNLIFYQVASFHAVETRNGKKLGVSNQIAHAGNCRDRLLGVSIAPNLVVDVKQFPLQGFAVLLSFQTKTDEARLISTVDLNLLPAPVILLSTVVSAVTVRESLGVMN